MAKVHFMKICFWLKRGHHFFDLGGLGAVLGALGPFLGDFVSLLGDLGSVLEDLDSVLGRSWGLLARSWVVSKAEERLARSQEGPRRELLPPPGGIS